MDILPIYRLFPYAEPQIIQILWQSILWGAHSLFATFFICYCIGVGLKVQPDNFVTFFIKYFNEFLAARLRVIIFSTLWFLVFIIPGFIMLIRYSLAEITVFFNPNFLEDRTQDPLDISSKKMGFKLGALILLSVLYFIIPMTIDSSFDHAHLIYEPSGRIFQIFAYTFLILFTYIYLFWAFTNFQEKKNV